MKSKFIPFLFTDNILAISVFFLPLLQPVSLICWGLLLIILFVKGEMYNLIINLRKNPGLVFFCLLYFFYLIGMLWTHDMKSGADDLLIKLPLLIFPVLFSSFGLTEKSFKKISIALISGCALALIICFFHSLKLYSETGDQHKFFYTSFSVFLHPTYFTMYLNLALLMICKNTFSEENKIFQSKIISVLLFFIMMAGVILLNARLAMVTVFITLIIFVVAEAINQKKLYTLFPRFIIQAALVVIVFFSLIQFNNRFVQISEAIQERKDTTAVLDTATQVYYNSTTIRIALFKNSLNVFKDNFFAGVGTGDVMPESVNQLERSGQHYLADHFTGAHNQYLQTAMSLGVFGLLLLILCIIFPLKDFFKSKNYLGICFVIIVLINALGDTILRASSLYFFTFFGCFLYTCNKRFFVKREF